MGSLSLGIRATPSQDMGGGHVPPGYPAQYAPYNGPGSAYQQGPLQGKGGESTQLLWLVKEMCLWQVIII